MRLKKIPSKFRVAGIDWTVKFTSNLAISDTALGLTDTSSYTITIQTGMSEQETQRVFLHEMMHVLFFSICEDKMSEDEVLVERCARAASEILASIK